MARPRLMTEEVLAEAAQMVAAGRSIEFAARVLGFTPRRLGGRLAEMADATALSRGHEETLAIPDDAPIAALADLAGEGICNRLRRAGYTTVGSVRHATNEQLLATEGIGPRIVNKVRRLGVAC